MDHRYGVTALFKLFHPCYGSGSAVAVSAKLQGMRVPESIQNANQTFALVAQSLETGQIEMHRTGLF